MKIESKWIAHKNKYYRFCTHLRRNWINVIFHEQVAPILEKHCQNPNAEKIEEESPIGTGEKIRLKPENLLHFVKSSTGAGSEWAFEWTLVSSIALFEAFASDIAELVYRSNPQEFLLSKDAKVDLELVLKCETTQEVIEKYIENKLIGIFYGNPRDAFVQYIENGKKGIVAVDGKLKLDTGSYLDGKDGKCATELQCYVEMSKRRNVIVHNAGIINELYVREVPNDNPNKLRLEDKVKIDKAYLFENIKALYSLARFYTIKAVHTAYKTGNKLEDDELLRQLEKEFK
jgi:hypothetical protein